MIQLHNCQINHFKSIVNVANTIFIVIIFGVVENVLIGIVVDLLIRVFIKSSIAVFL